MEKKQNLKKKAYEAIKKQIVDCTIEPNSILSEDILQKELGISRTPIREALVCLEHEGLITIMPKKGILVSNFTISDLCYTYEMRLLMEPYLIRNYAKKCELTALTEMRSRHISLLEDIRHGYSQEEQELLYTLDDSFHEMFFTICDNPYMKNMYTLIQSLCQRQRIMLGRINDTRVISTLEEHISILDLILSKEYDNAAEEMTAHLSKSQKASINTIINDPRGTLF